MSKDSVLNSLYIAHAADIASINQEFEGIVCPICLKPFDHKAVKYKKLTDGHIWPKDIRGDSSIAASQRVLLCAKCNHSAGSRGDKQMQLAQNLKKGDQSGELYGERRIDLIEKPGSKPISLQASVVINDENQTVDITGNWKRSNPNERRRFEKLVSKNEKFSYIFHQSDSGRCFCRYFNPFFPSRGRACLYCRTRSFFDRNVLCGRIPA